MASVGPFIITLVHRSNWDNHGPMTELVPLAKELGIKKVIIKMLQLSQVNLLFVPCPFKSVKQNIHSATMSGPQHKCKLFSTERYKLICTIGQVKFSLDKYIMAIYLSLDK